MTNIELDKNNRREVFGWLMYDWANSAYYTTVIGVLIGPYLISLAQVAVGDNGVVLDLGFFGSVTAKSISSATTVVGVAIQAVVMIFLSAIADFTSLKKVFMMILCYVGVFTGCLLFFVEGDNYLFGCTLLIISNVCIGSSLVFYNAYLSDICTEDQRDKVSAQGFGLGYAGGSVMLILNFLLLAYAPTLGITQGFAVRICLLAAALWWGGFAIVTFILLRNRGVTHQIEKGQSMVTVAFTQIWSTIKQLTKLRYTLMFLIAYLFYNDGIQTVIYSASAFISQELFVAKGVPSDPSFLLLLFLETQIVAMIGSFFWAFVSKKIGNKPTIMLSLVWWSCVVIYAYGFLSERWEAWILGAAIGFVLGGTQSLSRSLYSQMIPKGRESGFFSFYEISEKGTSWMGQLVFTVVVGSTGSFRQAILALIFFFVVGSIILFFTDTKKAIAEAAKLTAV
jgi:MFS transporter, UMF1 family